MKSASSARPQSCRQLPVLVLFRNQYKSNLLDHPDIRGVVINGRDITERIRTEAEKERVIAELQEAICKLDSLTGLLTICASGKKIHAENGSWQLIESYIRDRSEVEFTHTMGPECASLWCPDRNKK